MGRPDGGGCRQAGGLELAWVVSVETLIESCCLLPVREKEVT